LKVLVTGGAGFIGSSLVRQIAASGIEVNTLDCILGKGVSREHKLRRWNSLKNVSNVTRFELDLRHDDLSAALDGVTHVVNEAALPGMSDSWNQVAKYLDCNATATGRLIEACDPHTIEKFVQISTSSVYGMNAVGDESMPTHPYSPYGVTKLAGEHLSMAYFRNFEFPTVVLRYFSVYGPEQRPDMAYHIFAEKMLRGEEIIIYGNGSQTRSNTYIDDCVNATILAVSKGQPGEIFNIGGGETISLLEALELLANSLGIRPKIVFKKSRPGDQLHTKANFSKAAELLGYSPQVKPDIGLTNQGVWHRQLIEATS